VHLEALEHWEEFFLLQAHREHFLYGWLSFAIVFLFGWLQQEDHSMAALRLGRGTEQCKLQRKETIN
jgi:hypothetical protein